METKTNESNVQYPLSPSVIKHHTNKGGSVERGFANNTQFQVPTYVTVKDQSPRHVADFSTPQQQYPTAAAMPNNNKNISQSPQHLNSLNNEFDSKHRGNGMSGGYPLNVYDDRGGYYNNNTCISQNNNNMMQSNMIQQPSVVVPYELTVLGGLQRISINMSCFIEGITGINSDFFNDKFALSKDILFIEENTEENDRLPNQSSNKNLESVWSEINTVSIEKDEEINMVKSSSCRVMKPWLKHWIFTFAFYLLVHNIAIKIMKWNKGHSIRECIHYVVRFIATGGGKRQSV